MTITPQAFQTLFETLFPIPPSKIGIAVSGGPDSMALAFCLKRWARENNTSVRAFIVDHRLRDESAAEAQSVKDRLAQLEIETDILVWNHAPVTTRVHVHARDARYTLLLDACAQHNIPTLFLAHHKQDQAETILMRFAKGTGIDGLAGMAALTPRGNVTLARPFLSQTKEDLIATCQCANIAFVTDPSNTSDHYARGRLRAILPLLQHEGLSIDRLIDMGARAREAKDALDHAATAYLRAHVTASPYGFLTLDRAAFTTLPSAIASRVLATCLQTIHPENYPPEFVPLSKLTALAQDNTNTRAHTLHGCLMAPHKAALILMREPAHVTETKTISVGQTILWDNRWRITWGDDGLVTAQTVPLFPTDPRPESAPMTAPQPITGDALPQHSQLAPWGHKRIPFSLASPRV